MTPLEVLIQRGFRFALSLTHDSTRAEDLLQDAWVSVLRARGPWTTAYLFAAIRTRFVDDCRRSPDVQVTRIGDDYAYVESNLSKGSRTAEPGNDNGTLETVLGRLGAESRSILYLAAVERWTTREIATSLGIPRGTVLSRLHRSRARLRKLLQTMEKE